METIDGDVLDVSKKKLKKWNKSTFQETQNITTLILDDNELQRLDNIDSFTKLQKLSAVNNQLLRMYGVCRLHYLQTLNLAHNGILTIEGLKELTGLKWLSLAANSIKTIEHLNTNVALEYIDLSENNISHVNDISFLKNLRELYLHNNKINHLRQCDRFLPNCLTSLTLSNNNIEDLNEISQLVHLVNLNSISIANNPCVNFSINAIGFDYRPFVINWCLNIKTIDGYVVDAIESLRAEWLYSQGRGRHFRIGDHKELVQYLASVCPLTGETLETEEDRKLRIILSKAQHHQQQLREQSSESQTPSPISRKKLNTSLKCSPRLINSARAANSCNRTKSPDRIMSSSCYAPGRSNNTTIETAGSNISTGSVMTQSLDSSMLRLNNVSNPPLLNGDATEVNNSPLQALSKMVPVPESLMSPDYRPTSIIVPQSKSSSSTSSSVTTNSNKLNNNNNGKGIPVTTTTTTRSPKAVAKHHGGGGPAITNKPSSLKDHQHQQEQQKKRTFSPGQIRKPIIINNSNNQENNNKRKQSSSILRKSSSSEDESEMFMSKLQVIQMKANEKRLLQKDAEIISNSSSSIEDKVEQAAVCIQKIWRGYFTRNRNKEVQEVFRTLQAQRAGQYIEQLTTDMETTKAALESERKIQMLQTEAISALWKQMSALQPSSTTGNNKATNSQKFDNESNDNNEQVVKELTKTCSVLQTQIQQLQNSMQDIIKVMSVFSCQPSSVNNSDRGGMATQTEIVAVHTPLGEAAKLFPFQRQTRPSSLSLTAVEKSDRDDDNEDNEKANTTTHSEFREFSDHLVHGVINTVSPDNNTTENNCPLTTE